MNLVNLTPHPVMIYLVEACITLPGGRGYKLVDSSTTPVMVIAPSGVVARATQHEERRDPITADGLSIPICRMVYGAPVDLPEPEEGVGYIVSAITANAAKAAGRPTDDLFITAGMIRDEQGNIIGCTGFAKV